MKNYFLIFSLFYSAILSARTPASIGYRCDFKWQTIGENPIIKTVILQESLTVEMTPTIKVKLSYPCGKPA